MFGRSFGVFAAAAVFMLSVISLGATYGGGSGTAEDPYQIWTAEQMNTIGANYEVRIVSLEFKVEIGLLWEWWCLRWRG